MTNKTFAIVFTGLLVAPLGLANADTLRFQQGVSPDASYRADAVSIEKCTYQGCPAQSQNFDSSDVLFVGGIGRDYVAYRTLLEFDLTRIIELADPVTIDDVQLVLTQHGGQSTGLDSNLIVVEVHRLGDNWTGTFDFDDTQVTWNNAPNQPGATVGPKLSGVTFNPLSSSGAKQTWQSSTAFVFAVSRALKRADHTLRLILIAPEAENLTGAQSSVAAFDPDHRPTQDVRPELIVTYHPGVKISKASPAVILCLKVPQLCNESLLNANRFHDLDCAVDALLCSHLVQATDELQRTDAPPIDVFLEKSGEPSSPKHNKTQ